MRGIITMVTTIREETLLFFCTFLTKKNDNRSNSINGGRRSNINPPQFDAFSSVHWTGVATMATLQMCSAAVRGGMQISDNNNTGSVFLPHVGAGGGGEFSALTINDGQAVHPPTSRPAHVLHAPAVFFTPRSREFLLEIVGLVLFTIIVVSCRVFYPTPQELASLEPGDVALPVRIVIGDTIFFPATFLSTLLLAAMLREACMTQQRATVVERGMTGDHGGGGAIANDSSLTDLFGIDTEVLLLTAHFTLVNMLVFFLWYFFVGSTDDSAAAVVVWGYLFFRILPAAARRWNPAGGAHQNLSGFVRRSVVAGVPLVVLPTTLFPYVLKQRSPDDVSFFYPLFLSFIEYILSSVLFNDNVAAGYSDEALSVYGRVFVALIESSRIGMLVVITNSSMGSFSGLMSATTVGLVSEALARNNLIAMSWRKGKYGLKWYWHKLVSTVTFKPWQEPPPRRALNEMGRVKRAVLGAKVDTEYWGVFVLILTKWLGWGYGGASAPAMDADTGELLDVLDTPWRVIGAVAIGELAGDLLGEIIRLLMLRCAPPELRVNVPVVTPKRTGLILLMWLNLGGMFLYGIGSMGVLSDSLQEVSSSASS